MKNNIVKIIIFAVAIVTCILSIWFCTKFDQDKVANYNEATKVNQNNPEMIAALEAMTLENLPAFVEQYRAEGTTLSEELKAQQLQKDILYTYIVELKEQTEVTFPEYQAAFADHARSLFAKADNGQKYVDGFAAVTSFEQVAPYISSLEDEYAVVKQNFLDRKAYVKSFNSLVNQADAINQLVSETKKTEDLALFQSDVKSYISTAKLLNVTVLLGYLLFAVCFIALIYFALKAIFTNIKSSYKVLLVIVGIVVAAIVCYFAASSELTPSAIKEQVTPNQMKLIGAGMFMFYIAFIGAICSVIGVAISNAIKNR